MNLISSLSLPELSRRIPTTPLYYDYASSDIRGVSPVDGGFYLRPGFRNQTVYVGDLPAAVSADLRFTDDSYGHILPADPGSTVWIEILSGDGNNTAWAGNVVCTSRSSPTLPPSLSLKDLRAIVKFDVGSARVLIPESSISMGVSLLGLFMSIFYLLVAASKLERIMDTHAESGAPLIVPQVIKSAPRKLFLMNGPTSGSRPPPARPPPRGHL